jgi:peptidylprolyl isomerase
MVLGILQGLRAPLRVDPSLRRGDGLVRTFALALILIALPANAKAPLTMSEVLAASTPTDWRPLDADNALVMDLANGNRVVMELSPLFAPNHVANIKLLVREGFFDGLPVSRVQDNFVAQWGDVDNVRTLKTAKAKLTREFTRSAQGLPFTRLPDWDGWAPQVGFVNGLPAARDAKANLAWLAHCYGAVGVGRDNDPDSGGGTELYAIIGQSPRQLDRNITVVGRVVQGMEHLASLLRGTGAIGFYEKPDQRAPIARLRVVADMPPADRPALELLRTDTPTFAALIESRRNRRDAFYIRPAGHIDLCNVPLPVRTAIDAAGTKR